MHSSDSGGWELRQNTRYENRPGNSQTRSGKVSGLSPVRRPKLNHWSKKINESVMINQILNNCRSCMSHESTLLKDNGYKALPREREEFLYLGARPAWGLKAPAGAFRRRGKKVADVAGLPTRGQKRQWAQSWVGLGTGDLVQ